MRRKEIILDANLLLLLVVGLTCRRYISLHKRLQAYEEADFVLLLSLLGSTNNIIVTPNTLTETSNLAGQIGEPARSRIYERLREILFHFDERYVESKRAAELQEFSRLGLSDVVQLELAREAATLLTVDLDLYLAAVGRGWNAENFNHYRQM